jgi:hypothetical protein
MNILKDKVPLSLNMENGTFFGRYDSRIDEWEKNIKEAKDQSDIKKFENEMYDYMADCLPYLIRHMRNDDDGEEEIDPIFHTKVKKGPRRREIYYDYLREVENYNGNMVDNRNKQSNIKLQVCKNCNSSNIYIDHHQSENICTDCGLSEYFLGEELTYKEEQEHWHCEKIVNNSYKRDNHLNEWILQFQGQETTNIPDEVIEQLRSEFKKQKIKDVNEITQTKVKQLLKKLRLSKYYEHSTYITNIINGLNPPSMPNQLEERLRYMFKEIQEPFEKHCPKNRSNFLSYSYVLYKFCELLEEDEYLPYFPLLKSKEKLRQQDVIWKGICSELQWEYIPTC